MERGVQGRVRAVVTDKMRATIINHVINHGLSQREAGDKVQPTFNCMFVALKACYRTHGLYRCNKTERNSDQNSRGI